MGGGGGGQVGGEEGVGEVGGGRGGGALKFERRVVPGKNHLNNCHPVHHQDYDHVDLRLPLRGEGEGDAVILGAGDFATFEKITSSAMCVQLLPCLLNINICFVGDIFKPLVLPVLTCLTQNCKENLC